MDSFPPGVRSVLSRLEQRPLREPEALRAEVDAYDASLARPGVHHPFADAELARRIASGCRILVGDPRNRSVGRLRLVQSAVDYLILADDAESDADSVLGFDDDALVFDAIARALGRPDLVVGETPA